MNRHVEVALGQSLPGGVQVNCWVLHKGRLSSLVSEDRFAVLASVRRRVAKLGSDEVRFYERELHRWLSTHEVPSVQALLLEASTWPNQLCWYEGPMTWSNIAEDRKRAALGENVRCEFSSWVPADDATVRLAGTFDPRHVTCSTANVELRGTTTQYLFGTASHDGKEIMFRPIAIAERYLTSTPTPWANSEWQMVSPRQVDQFGGVDWDLAVSLSDLDRLRTVSESEVKHVLAQMLGEQTVQKDWGGELMDLWSTRLSVNGQQMHSAFLLKGPANFRPMTIASLGKPGDQLERLRKTAANLLVIQHCHEITPNVVGMLQAFASDYRNPRRYMILDGFDTFRLLRAEGRV